MEISAVARKLAGRIPPGERSIRTRMMEVAAGLTNVVSLGRGDPDLATPGHVIAAAQRALELGATHYTHPAGTPELRQAIARKLARENGISVDPAGEVMVTLGAQEAVYLTMLALLEPGDEVIVFNPRYTAYDWAVQLAGGRVVPVQTLHNGEFELRLADVEAAITPRTKLICLVTPDNPTGGMVKPETIRGLAELAQERDLLVLSDEIYEYFIYDGTPHLSIGSLPGMKERTITVNGFSKAYAMTGWRVGYLAGPADFIARINEVKHTLTICTPAVSQAAALAALTGPQDCLAEFFTIYKERRAFLRTMLDGAGLRSVGGQGGFYLYADISSTGMEASEFCLEVLREKQVWTSPGPSFGEGQESYIRLTVLSPLEQLQEAGRRLQAFVRERGR